MRTLSRPTLNALILLCMAVILWLNLSQPSTPARLPDLALPALTSADWHYRLSGDGVEIWLRAGGTVQGGTLALATASHTQRLPLPAEYNPADLNALAITPEQAVILLISGPWPLRAQQQLAATLIRQFRLQPLTLQPLLWPGCLQRHAAGALWLAQQQQRPWWQLPLLTASLAAALPGNDDWADWRLQQSRTLRQQWQDEQGQIDIQARLAYHRLPDNTYPALYQALGQAQPTDVADALSCLPPPAVQAPHHE